MTNESKESISVTVDDEWDEMVIEATATPNQQVRLTPMGTPVKAGPGRPKGLKNKSTELRQAFYDAFDRTGGIDKLVEFALSSNSNYKVFLQTLSKVLPKDDQIQGDIAVQVVNYIDGQRDGEGTT